MVGRTSVRGTRMPTSRLAVCTLSLLHSAAIDAHAGAKCGDAPGDEAAVAALRAQVAAQCDCSPGTSHNNYVKCAKKVIKQATDVSKDCRKKVQHCASSSTC